MVYFLLFVPVLSHATCSHVWQTFQVFYSIQFWAEPNSIARSAQYCCGIAGCVHCCFSPISLLWLVILLILSVCLAIRCWYWPERKCSGHLTAVFQWKFLAYFHLFFPFFFFFFLLIFFSSSRSWICGVTTAQGWGFKQRSFSSTAAFEIPSHVSLCTPCTTKACVSFIQSNCWTSKTEHPERETSKHWFRTFIS